MAAFVSGQNQFALLANAFTGAAKGAQDFAKLKMQRDQMAQQQRQFDDNLALGFSRLDEQIRQFDVGTAEHSRLTELSQELKLKMSREGYVAAEQRSRIAAGPGHARVAEQTRQFDYLKTQAAQQDNAINQFVTTLPPLPTVDDVEIPQELKAGDASPESMAELERLTALRQSAEQRRNSAIVQQTDWLAAQLSGPKGQITQELRKRAAAIISDKEGYSRRVYTRAQNLASAKRGQLSGGAWEGAREAAGGWETPYGFVSTATGEAAQFEVPYQHKQFGLSEDGSIKVTAAAMESVYADTKSPAGQQKIKQFQDAGVGLFTMEKLNEEALARQFEVVIAGMDPGRALFARSAMDDWVDQYDSYQGRPVNQEINKLETAQFERAGSRLDSIMGNTNGQMRKASQVAMQYARTHTEDLLSEGGVVGTWADGTARAVDVAGNNPAVQLRAAVASEASQAATRLLPEAEYHDDIIDAWDAAIGGINDAARRRATASVEEMMGSDSDRLAQLEARAQQLVELASQKRFMANRTPGSEDRASTLNAEADSLNVAASRLMSQLQALKGSR